MTYNRSIYQLLIRPETSFGTSAASWRQVRCEEPPTYSTKTYELVGNAKGGTRNPLDISAKPEKIQKMVEGLVTVKTRIYRAETDGNVCNLATFFKSSGWNVNTTSAATTTSGTPTTTAIDLAADVGGVGEALLIERDAGVYVPVLASAYSTQTVTPSIALTSAPAASEVVEIMHTMTPTTSTTYRVPTDATLQMQMKTYGQYDDAAGDLAFAATGCAMTSVGELTVAKAGEYPTLDLTFSGVPSDMTAVDIAADSFYDSGRFPVFNDDLEFCFCDYDSVGTNVNHAIDTATINFGVSVIPIMGEGSSDVVGGAVGYLLKQSNPTITITTPWIKKTTFEYEWIQQLEGSNTSKYIHVVQPTRDLDQPAWGVWMPKCHLQPGGEPSIDVSGDMIMCTATFEADIAGYNSETDIDEVGAAPIYFAISGEAA